MRLFLQRTDKYMCLKLFTKVLQENFRLISTLNEIKHGTMKASIEKSNAVNLVYKDLQQKNTVC